MIFDGCSNFDPLRFSLPDDDDDEDEVDGIKNSKMAEAIAIIESSTTGKMSFQINPLVIHAAAVKIKTIATNFSSLLICPSSPNFFLITFLSPITSEFISVILPCSGLA